MPSPVMDNEDYKAGYVAGWNDCGRQFAPSETGAKSASSEDIPAAIASGALSRLSGIGDKQFDKERKLRRYQVWSVSDGIDVRPDLEGPLVYYSDVEQLERELTERNLRLYEALALLRELNDALVIPKDFQARVDAILDRQELGASETPFLTAGGEPAKEK